MIKLFICILQYTFTDAISMRDQTLSQSSAVDWTSTDIIGKWCMVRYDDDIYPGIATDDTNIQVKCMHSGGPN